MATQGEKVIENEILRYLAMSGVLCWKVKTVGTFDPKKGRFRRPSKLYMKGVSDILGVLPGGKSLSYRSEDPKGPAKPAPKTISRALYGKRRDRSCCTLPR
jgi:hypothetical protein